MRAYAINGSGVGYGSDVVFTTLEHAYVDLGLPSGTLWATCNVGANVPEAHGDYFAWGETQPKTTYNWGTYRYCNGNYDQLTKYCNNSEFGYNGFTDNLTTLLPEDDAATVNWGEEWRMPTKEQWQELFQTTTNIWTTPNGMLFTASNGNSLFLPGAGYLWDNEQGFVGNCGEYWSNSLYFSRPREAWWFFCDSGGCGLDNDGYRDGGLSVRPVRSVK